MTAPKVADVPLAKLTPAPWNPRTIRDERFKNLCASIEADPEFLWRRPILAMADGTIYAGNMRYRAASHLGLKAVPAIVEDVPEQLAKERALRDNAQWGDWNDDQLAEMVYQMAASGSDVKLLGIEEDELARLLGMTGVGGTEGLTDPDELPENVPTRSKRGDLWLLGEHRVLCGDATAEGDVVRLFDGKRPDMLLTDPPYCSGGFQESGRSSGSIGTDAKVKRTIANDTLSTRGYIALIRSVLNLSPCAAAYVFTDWRMWVNLFDVVESSGFGVRNMIVWDKGSPGMGMGWRTQHELIMFGVKAKLQWDNHHKAVGNVVAAKRSGNELHPTQKPVDLLRVVLDLMDMVDGVYDPFAGSGSTLIACEEVGQRCYAIDLDPKWIDVILQRWENFTGKTAVLA